MSDINRFAQVVQNLLSDVRLRVRYLDLHVLLARRSCRDCLQALPAATGTASGNWKCIL